MLVLGGPLACPTSARARSSYCPHSLRFSWLRQYLPTLNFNPGLRWRASSRLQLHLPPSPQGVFHHIQPIAAYLPPGLIASLHRQLQSGSSPRSRWIPFLASSPSRLVFFKASTPGACTASSSVQNLSEVTKQSQPSARRTTPTAVQRPSLPLATAQAASPTHTLSLQQHRRRLPPEGVHLPSAAISTSSTDSSAPLFMVFLFATRFSASGRYGDLAFPRRRRLLHPRHLRLSPTTPWA